MAMFDAVKFLKEAAKNESLRDGLYAFDSRKERMDHLESLGYSFDDAEMEQAFYHLKLESPDAENANLVEDLFFWWRMINQN